jgi:hypothetical protein
MASTEGFQSTCQRRIASNAKTQYTAAALNVGGKDGDLEKFGFHCELLLWIAPSSQKAVLGEHKRSTDCHERTQE